MNQQSNLNISQATIYSNHAVTLVLDNKSGKVYTITNNIYANVLDFVNDVAFIGEQIRQSFTPQQQQNLYQPQLQQTQFVPPVQQNFQPQQTQIPQQFVQQIQQPQTPINQQPEVIQFGNKTFLKIGNQLMEVTPQSQQGPQMMGQDITQRVGVSEFHEKASPNDFAPRPPMFEQAKVTGASM